MVRWMFATCLNAATEAEANAAAEAEAASANAAAAIAEGVAPVDILDTDPKREGGRWRRKDVKKY